MDQEQIQKVLAERHACYVLITCDAPTPDGNMEVRMSYEGDPTLASYLLRGAKDIIEEA